MSRNGDLLSVAPVTMLFLGVNLALYAYCAIASNNVIRIENDVLVFMGMSMREYVWQGDWFRLIMPMFLHSGFIHILMNTIVLYQYGPATEIQFGRSNFCSLYLLSGIGGIAFSQIFGGHHSIGASTSVFGVMGALLALTVLRVPVLKYAYRNSAVRGQAAWIGIMFACGILRRMGAVDNWGHLGGFVFGLVSGGFFEFWRLQKRLALPLILTVAVLLGAFVVGARWSVLNPYYHLHLGVLAGDTGDNALQQIEFQKARKWSEFWSNQRNVELLIQSYESKEFNADLAARIGYHSMIEQIRWRATLP